MDAKSFDLIDKADAVIAKAIALADIALDADNGMDGEYSKGALAGIVLAEKVRSERTSVTLIRERLRAQQEANQADSRPTGTVVMILDNFEPAKKPRRFEKLEEESAPDEAEEGAA